MGQLPIPDFMKMQADPDGVIRATKRNPKDYEQPLGDFLMGGLKKTINGGLSGEESAELDQLKKNPWTPTPPGSFKPVLWKGLGYPKPLDVPGDPGDVDIPKPSFQSEGGNEFQGPVQTEFSRFDPAEAAKSLGVLGKQSFNPSSELYRLQDTRKGELDDRIAATIRAEGDQSNEVKGLKAYAGILDKDISENPIARGIDFDREIEDANNAARKLGFGGDPSSPLSQASAYTRELESRKANAPLDVARINAQGDIEKQRIASQGLLDISNSKTEQAQNFMEMLQQLGGLQGLRSVTVPNAGGSVGFQPEPKEQSQYFRDLTNNSARLANAEKVAAERWTQAGAEKDLAGPQAAYKQSLAQALSQLNLDPDMELFVSGIMQDKNYRTMPLDNILEKMGYGDMPDDHRYAIAHALLRLRGF